MSKQSGRFGQRLAGRHAERRCDAMRGFPEKTRVGFLSRGTICVPTYRVDLRCEFVLAGSRAEGG